MQPASGTMACPTPPTARHPCGSGQTGRGNGAPAAWPHPISDVAVLAPSPPTDPRPRPRHAVAWRGVGPGDPGHALTLTHVADLTTHFWEIRPILVLAYSELFSSRVGPRRCIGGQCMRVNQLSVGSENADFPARCRAEGISKARVKRNVGQSAALSAEQACVGRVWPIGVLHNPAGGLHGDLAALALAGAIGAGLAFTATGLLKIRWTRPAGPPQEVGSTLRDFRAGMNAQPVLPLDIDVSSPPKAIDARRAGQPPYASALCLLTATETR